MIFNRYLFFLLVVTAQYSFAFVSVKKRFHLQNLDKLTVTRQQQLDSHHQNTLALTSNKNLILSNLHLFNANIRNSVALRKSSQCANIATETSVCMIVFMVFKIINATKKNVRNDVGHNNANMNSTEFITSEKRVRALPKKLLCTALLHSAISFLNNRTQSQKLPFLISHISHLLFMFESFELLAVKILNELCNFANVKNSFGLRKIVSLTSFLTLCHQASLATDIPLKKMVSVGGIAGALVGLSVKELTANIIGSLILIVNQPFVPGESVSFKSGGNTVVGKVEAVEWGQTRIRCKDTRVTYVPNAHFIQNAITNLDRYSHRKLETSVVLRMEDAHAVSQVVSGIREILLSQPKLDAKTMPLRVSFTRITSAGLEVEVLAYFALRSSEEFAQLQQTVNLEVLRLLQECGVALA